VVQAAVGSVVVLEHPESKVAAKPKSVSASTDNLMFNIWQPWKIDQIDYIEPL
jgi:hypothetical protein